MTTSSEHLYSTDASVSVSSRRRPVGALPMVEYRKIVVGALISIIIVVFFGPFLLGNEWYNNKFFADFGWIFCLIILCSPIVGFWVGNVLLRRCARIATAAETIDGMTGQFHENDANFRTKSRDELFGYYENLQSSTDAIVQTILSDALNRAMVDRWEPASWIVDARWSELSSGLPLLATLQRIALQLGILFTFIGLAVAFSRFQVNTVGGPPDLQPLFEALQVKFISSIVGLIASIWLLALGWVCRRELARTVARLETMADNILTLAKLLRNDVRFASNLSSLKDVVRELGKDVAGLQTVYREELQGLKEDVRQVKKQVDGIRNGYIEVVKTVDQAGSEFNNNVSSVMSEQRRVVTEIEQFYRQLSPQGISENLATVLNDSMGVFSQRLSSAAEALAATHKAVEELATVERVRANDDMGATQRHRELLYAIRALQPNMSGKPEDGKRKAGWLLNQWKKRDRA